MRVRDWRRVASGRAVSLAVTGMIAAIVVGLLNPEFVSASNLMGFLSAASPIVIMSVGVGMVVIAGEIDISVGSMYGTLAALLAVLASPAHAGWPVWIVVLVVVSAGAFAGLVNGLVTVWGGVPSIVTSLGAMSILRGVTERILGGEWVTDLPPGLRAIGTGALLGVPISVYVAGAILVLGLVLTRRTAFGVGLYAVGDHAAAARLARVRLRVVKLAAFTMSGVLVGVAALVSVPQLSVVESGLGVGMELAVVTAIVVGGVSISGGRGSLMGAAVAAVVLGMVRPVLLFLKLGSTATFWELAIQGACILAAVLADRSAHATVVPTDAAGEQARKPWSIAGILLLVMAGAWWMSPEFVSPSVQALLAPQLAEVALLAVAMTLVILTGGIDLSVGSTMALAAVTAGLLHEKGLPPAVSAAGAVVVGTLCGWLNGLFVTRASIHPLVVTLATLALYRGLAQGISGGRPISGFADGWTKLGTAQVLGVPVVLVPAIAAGALVAIVLTRTTWGARLRALGVNEMAARYCGVRVDRLKVWAYTLAGTAAGVSACLFIARRNTAKADVGVAIELEVITACVLGGVSLSGGRGGIAGVAIGVVLIHEIRQLASWLGYHDEVIQIVLGAVLIASVLMGHLFGARMGRQGPVAQGKLV